MKRGPKPAIQVETSQLCSHGCGNIAKFLSMSGKYLCEHSSNKCEAVKKKNINGVTKAHAENRMPGFSAEQQIKGSKNSLQRRIELRKWNCTYAPWDNIPKNCRWDRLFFEQDGKCEICKMLPIWNDKPLKFQVDHIDGTRDSSRKNLRLICANCHTQTSTFCAKNASAEGRIRMGYKRKKI